MKPQLKEGVLPKSNKQINRGKGLKYAGKGKIQPLKKQSEDGQSSYRNASDEPESNSEGETSNVDEGDKQEVGVKETQSDSSLTAVSYDDELDAEENFSIPNQSYRGSKIKPGFIPSRNVPMKGTRKSVKSYKSDNKGSAVYSDSESSCSSELENVDLSTLHNLSYNKMISRSDEDISDSGEEHDFSSSDDSDVDFVRLQAEKKAMSMQAFTSSKGLLRKSNKRKGSVKEIQKEKRGSQVSMRRSSSISMRKLSKRNSIALPDKMNLKIEISEDERAFSATDIEKDEPNKTEMRELAASYQAEDIGEEIHPRKDSSGVELSLDSKLMEDSGPNEVGIASDDENEIDDKLLLETLRADEADQYDFNDTSLPGVDGYILENMGEDEEEELFLREEEKYLVNEFENNGFDDDDGLLGDYNDDNVSRKNALDSFHEFSKSEHKDVVQYATSSGESESSTEDEDDYIDLDDFDIPTFDNKTVVRENTKENQKGSQKASRHGSVSKIDKELGTELNNSDEEDDFYLWNYFFSSDNDNNSTGSDGEEVYVNDFEGYSFRKQVTGDVGINEQLIAQPAYALDDYISSDDSNDSGDSTDEEVNLPPSSGKRQGFERAKEVLSSKTADYRPPVLGTWVALHCKPFGVIDGLSTRMLHPHPNMLNNQQKSGNSGVLDKLNSNNNINDPVIGLEEILNVNELDNEDENDVRIWRDFNDRKATIPLGAFRNRSTVNNTFMHNEDPLSTLGQGQEHKRYSSFHNMNEKSHKETLLPRNKKLAINKPSHKQRRASLQGYFNIQPDILPSLKEKTRRDSIAEAVSEGYMPTTSGLFSQAAIAEVEDTLGNEVDIISQVKGI